MLRHHGNPCTRCNQRRHEGTGAAGGRCGRSKRAREKGERGAEGEVPEMEMKSGDVEQKQEANDVWDRKQTGWKVGERRAGCWKKVGGSEKWRRESGGGGME